MRYSIYVLFLIFPMFVSSKHQLIKYKYGSAPEHQINKIQIFGERCSGTNFLEHLIVRNFKNIKKDTFFWYGEKHFPCWFDFPFDEKFYQRPLYNYTLEKSKDVLFIVIFRDPYDWVRSFYKSPHHAISSLKTLSFSEFIRSKWEVENDIENPYRFPIELNPKTGAPFDNVMKLRTARIINMLRLKDLVPFVYFINYEILNEFPREVLTEISELFGVEMNDQFTPVLTDKGNEDVMFTPSRYRIISPADLDFINQNLDEKVEKSIGYRFKSEVL